MDEKKQEILDTLKLAKYKLRDEKGTILEIVSRICILDADKELKELYLQDVEEIDKSIKEINKFVKYIKEN